MTAPASSSGGADNRALDRPDGLYAVASLDGAPVSAGDRQWVGLSPTLNEARCIAVMIDRGIGMVSDGPCLFLGHLDEPAEVAATLGMAPTSRPQDIADAALRRFGDEAPSRLLGEWSFLSWDDQAKTLTLMASDTLRDPILFATDGRRVAVASQLQAIRSLPWVGTALDSRGVLVQMRRPRFQPGMPVETILRHVRQVGAGTCVTIGREGARVGRRRPLPVPVAWRGSFDEAIEELDYLLRRIVREHLVRHSLMATMLSGGLDSSLLSTIAAAERQGSSLFAVTSAAPLGSNLPDELDISNSVARQAGIGVLPVRPPTEASAYFPSEATLAWLRTPRAGPRHYLYDALYRAASDHGAAAILDGTEGEWTVTGYLDEITWRERAANALRSVISRSPRGDREQLQDRFPVRLSAGALDLAKAELEPTADLLATPHDPPRRSDLWGYYPLIEMAMGETTTTPIAGLRRLMPFRDRRLLTLFAGMPRHFMVQGNQTRAPGRALLKGRVPEAVRLRRHGCPFSPDYLDRIRRQALQARKDLPGLRRDGVGEWIDLDWLDKALTRLAGRAGVSLDLAFGAQATCASGAFLSYWLTGRGTVS